MADPSIYFEEAAKKHFGKFEEIEETHGGGKGVILHTSSYILKFKHNKLEVEIVNNFGHRNLGSVKCMLPRRPDYFAFIVTANGPWKQLLLRMRPFKVNCYNPALINKIERLDSFLDLSELARKERFEPNFIGDNRAYGFEITCNYHLNFNDQGQAIEPLVQFVKDLIDIFSHEA